jgi:hypothetical protein
MAGRRGGGPRLDGAPERAAESPAQVRVLEKRFLLHGASVFFIYNHFQKMGRMAAWTLAVGPAWPKRLYLCFFFNRPHLEQGTILCRA